MTAAEAISAAMAESRSEPFRRQVTLAAAATLSQ